jgi:prepilin-type N-terminal cleavage/methylation domain-containing protein
MTAPRRGFTLIELIVVMAIVALLISIAAPRYYASVDRARENSLRGSLAVMRHAIDQYTSDRGRYPDSLEELVDSRYLRSLPEDPVSGRRDSWVGVNPPSDSALPGKFYDVRSGAAGRTQAGVLYADL